MLCPKPHCRTKLVSEDDWVLLQANANAKRLAAQKVTPDGEIESDPNADSTLHPDPTDGAASLRGLLARVEIGLLRAKFQTQLRPLLSVLERVKGQTPPDFGRFIGWYRRVMEKKREKAEKRAEEERIRAVQRANAAASASSGRGGDRVGDRPGAGGLSASALPWEVAAGGMHNLTAEGEEDGGGGTGAAALPWVTLGGKREGGDRGGEDGGLPAMKRARKGEGEHVKVGVEVGDEAKMGVRGAVGPMSPRKTDAVAGEEDLEWE